MNPGLVVKLRPAGPWRIGPDSGARNRVDAIYHSDSLFSAVTSAMARMGSLAEWLDATARTVTPAVCFSSCFPFLDEVVFVVPPRTIWPPVSPALLSARVRWKSARFVPLAVVQAMLSGEKLNAGQWSVDGASGCLVPAGRGGPFRTGVRWNAAVDRLSGASERHATACIEFRPGSGLWTIAAFADDAARDRWQDPVKAAFRLLADTGFGGERSRGWGRAETPEFVEGSLPEMIIEDRKRPDHAPLEASAEPAAPQSAAAPPSAAAGSPGVPSEPSPVPPIQEPPVEQPPAPEPPAELPPLDPDPAYAAHSAEPGAPGEPSPVPPPQEPPSGEPPVTEPSEPLPEQEPPPAPPPATDPPAESPDPDPEPSMPPVGEPEAAIEPALSDAPLEAALRAPESIAELRAEGGSEAGIVEESGAQETNGVPIADAESAATEEPAEPASESEAQTSPETAELPVEPAAPPPATRMPGPALQAHWLLSLFTPAPADAVDWARGSYTVLARGGRVDSPSGSGELKKQIQMVAEGSVLYADGVPRGSAADVAPDGFAHPVFRAGFALSIRLPEVH